MKTLETLREEHAPGSRWAFYIDPNEFKLRGDSVRKSPVYHADPWILENLRQLRPLRIFAFNWWILLP